jgi:hypothetical protein
VSVLPCVIRCEITAVITVYTLLATLLGNPDYVPGSSRIIGTRKVNWLTDRNMLKKSFPQARIMCFNFG